MLLICWLSLQLVRSLIAMNFSIFISSLTFFDTSCRRAFVACHWKSAPRGCGLKQGWIGFLAWLHFWFEWVWGNSFRVLFYNLPHYAVLYDVKDPNIWLNMILATPLGLLFWRSDCQAWFLISGELFLMPDLINRGLEHGFWRYVISCCLFWFELIDNSFYLIFFISFSFFILFSMVLGGFADDVLKEDSQAFNCTGIVNTSSSFSM